MSLSVHIYKELEDFTLNVQFDTEREFLALLGASGCGKSMTLRCIAGLATPDRGKIVLNDEVLFDSEAHVNLPPRRREVGYIFRNYALFPHMTVRQNLLAAAHMLSGEEQNLAVDEKLDTFRLTGLEDRYPRQLSGGQRHRLALARALITEPELLLLDEPFAPLDSHLRWQAELELKERLRVFPGPVLLTSHDRDEVCRLCDTACVLAEGHSEEKMAVRDLMAQPMTVEAAVISGCKNFSRVKRVEAGRVECLNWGVTLETTQRVTNICSYAGIHSFDLHIARSGEPNRFDARVVRVIRDASGVILLLAPEGGNALLRMEMSAEEWTALREPEVLLVGVSPQHVMTLSGELNNA